MRSAGLKLSAFALLVFLAFPAAPALVAEEKPWTDQFLSEFNGLKTRLAIIEQTQRDILAEKEEIIQEIDRVRIWARHSGD
ncbi:MAG TPA: hypothetical protein PKV84_05645 [Candidatus Omnitrophota bacterium]|jgi:hypothetical protein|nr:hypothetical protein [Candidatus Omnitrophota bacterium]